MDQKARDRRLRKLYGISADEYEQMLAAQNGVCKICGSPPVTRSLHVDHTHKFKYLSVTTYKVQGGWVARVDALVNPETGQGPLIRWAAKKNAAIRAVREVAKRLSVRGLICFPCNGGLRKFRDNSLFLAAAADYLRQHAERVHGY